MAIAFDAAAGGHNGGSGSTCTVALTCTGANLGLVVGVCGNPDNTMTCTYNGVSMTEIANDRQGTSRRLWLFYLNAPATGTHNIVATSGVSGEYILLAGASYTGVTQSGQPEAFGTNKATGTSLATSVTTVAAGAWMILVGKTEAGTIGAGTGSTVRSTDGFNGGGNGITGIFDSNGTLSPGSNSMTYTSPSSHDLVGLALSLAPEGAASTPTRPLFHRSQRFFRRVI